MPMGTALAMSPLSSGFSMIGAFLASTCAFEAKDCRPPVGRADDSRARTAREIMFGVSDGLRPG